MRELTPEAIEQRRAYQRAWREKNADRVRQRNREWREKNPDKAKKSNRIWREKNREKRNAYMRKWNKENPEKIRETQNRYWAKKAAAMRSDDPNPSDASTD